ncbi:MAG: LysR family transcriptional regulator, partial [Burkholderiaceae bacterium]
MPLEDIRVFEAVARHLSFSAAADELALTHGAVSKRVKALESKCGALLLQRSSRKVALTRAGQLLWAAASSALGQLDAAWQTVAAAATRRSPQRIVVSCERSLALRWLIPRLADFQARYPGVVVHVHAGGGTPDFGAEGVDLAIRRNDFVPASGLQIEPLMPEAMALVLAPALLPAWQQAPQRVRRLHTATRPLAWARWDAARSP